jgi:hypothetical protein
MADQEVDIVQKYQAGGYQFPDRNINPILKQEPNYAISICSAIFSYYLLDYCGISYSAIGGYDETRAYANGMQSTSKYEYLFKHEDTTQAPTDATLQKGRKGTDNINKRIISPAAQISLAIKGALSGIDYNVVADTIDPDSVYDKHWEMSRQIELGQNQKDLNIAKQIAGLPTDDNDYPKTADELKLMDELGEFKQPVAMCIQELIKHSYDISAWETIKNRCIEDARDFSKFCIKEYFDQESAKYKIEYVDITRLLCQYSDRRDFSDSGYFAEIKCVKLYEIRPMLERAGYTETDIRDVAYSWVGQAAILSAWGGTGNPGRDLWEQQNRINTYGTWLYDYFNILILDTTWIENDHDYKFFRPNKINGELTSYRGKYGKINENTVVTTLKRRYQAKWVIGTNYVFDNGIAPSQPWDADNRRPLMPYNAYVSSEISITKRLEPIYDMFQITWLKLQNENSKLHNEITLIDQTVLQRSLQNKDSANTILKVLTKMQETGVLPYSSLPPRGNYPGGAVKPIEKIPSTLLNAINEAITQFKNAFDLITMLTGISPVAMGQQPENREAVANVEQSLQSTQKVLDPLVQGLMLVKEDSAEFLADAIRLAVRNDKKSYEAYAKVTTDVDKLKESTYSSVELGIKLRPKPNQMEMQQLIMDLNKYSSPGQDGNQLVTPDIEMRVREMIFHGADLTHVRYYLSSAIKKATDHRDKMKQQLIQQQIDGNMKQKQMDVQGDMQLEKQKGDNKLKEIAADSEAKLKLNWQQLTHEKQMAVFQAQQDQLSNEQGQMSQ